VILTNILGLGAGRMQRLSLFTIVASAFQAAVYRFGRQDLELGLDWLSKHAGELPLEEVCDLSRCRVGMIHPPCSSHTNPLPNGSSCYLDTCVAIHNRTESSESRYVGGNEAAEDFLGIWQQPC
jgi:hypothetical protein